MLLRDKFWLWVTRKEDTIKTLNNVGWECFNACEKPETIDRIIEEAKDFPNISRVVIDDFKNEEDGVPRYKKLPISVLEEIILRQVLILSEYSYLPTVAFRMAFLYSVGLQFLYFLNHLVK